jgi:hypothetical protein
MTSAGFSQQHKLHYYKLSFDGLWHSYHTEHYEEYQLNGNHWKKSASDILKAMLAE